MLVMWVRLIEAIHCLIAVFFFFQAEDGIRDLVRSRGLGDVYKRQGDTWILKRIEMPPHGEETWSHDEESVLEDVSTTPVSYTHLTLPTSDLV